MSEFGTDKNSSLYAASAISQECVILNSNTNLPPHLGLVRFFYSKENTIKNDTNLFWIMNMCPPHNEGNEGTDTVDDTR